MTFGYNMRSIQKQLINIYNVFMFNIVNTCK